VAVDDGVVVASESLLVSSFSSSSSRFLRGGSSKESFRATALKPLFTMFLSRALLLRGCLCVCACKCVLCARTFVKNIAQKTEKIGIFDDGNFQIPPHHFYPPESGRDTHTHTNTSTSSSSRPRIALFVFAQNYHRGSYTIFTHKKKEKEKPWQIPELLPSRKGERRRRIESRATRTARSSSSRSSSPSARGS